MFFLKRKSLPLNQTHSLSGEASAPLMVKRPQMQAPVHEVNGYLQGQLLVSTPLINGGGFHRSVIFLFAHNPQGAMGLIINQPMERAELAELVEDKPEGAVVNDQEIDVYCGGPVEKIRGFVLHSGEYKHPESIYEDGRFAVSAHAGVLQDMLADKGPRHAMLCVGYAGWGAGQLEQEIEENGWITVPADPALVFGVDDELKWALASRSLGIDMNFFSPTAGHA